VRGQDVVDMVRTAVAQRQGELIDLAQRLIKIPSENPPGDTSEISAFVADYLRAHDWEPHWYEPSRGAVSLVATAAGGCGRHVILCGHSDTVPAGDHSACASQRTLPRMPLAGAGITENYASRGALGDMPIADEKEA